MASKKSVAPLGTDDLMAAVETARNNPYVQRLADDAELRDDLRAAFNSARRAFDRISGKGPVSAIEDKRVQRDLKDAAGSLRSAADSLRGAPAKSRRKRGGRGKLVLAGIVGAGLAVALNEGLRSKVLDALFGAEEEFEYQATTTPGGSNGSAAETPGQQVGA